MKMEHMILYIIYACTIISLAFIPKNKWKEASLVFLFQQCVTWFLGLLVVELHLIEYPVREFSNVNGTSFLFEFLAYPIISAFFCICFPRTSTNWRKFFYISAFCTAMTISEIIFVKYTNLITYVHWDWYITWLTLYASLFLVWKFYNWYFEYPSSP